MSRSYRKIPKFSRNDQFYKRLSNKRNRRSDIDSGGAHKKNLCSWNICDYKGIVFRESEIERIVNECGYTYMLQGYTK